MYAYPEARMIDIRAKMRVGNRKMHTIKNQLAKKRLISKIQIGKHCTYKWVVNSLGKVAVERYLDSLNIDNNK